MEIDINQLLASLIAGGAIYAGIRVELRFMWRDQGRMNTWLGEVDGRVRDLERIHPVGSDQKMPNNCVT